MREATTPAAAPDTPFLGPSHEGSGPKKASVNTSHTISSPPLSDDSLRLQNGRAASSPETMRRAARGASQPFAEYGIEVRHRSRIDIAGSPLCGHRSHAASPYRDGRSEGTEPRGAGTTCSHENTLHILCLFPLHRCSTPFNTGHLYTTLRVLCQG